MATRTEVVNFLNLFKGCLMLDRFSVKDREKNLQALIELGITTSERKESLLGLVPEDYVAGPKPDDTDSTKEIWEFGKTVADKDVYIKLRVVPVPGRKNLYHATIWSFHSAEYPLKYPLRGRES